MSSNLHLGILGILLLIGIIMVMIGTAEWPSDDLDNNDDYE